MTAESRLAWARSQRVISTRFPTIHLFADIAASDDWDNLEHIANLTSQRVRQNKGGWGMFRPEDCAQGEAATLAMAPFTTPNPAGSRFADETYGAYYAGRDLETAIDETVFHTEKFAREGRMPTIAFEKQVIEACICGSFQDLRKKLPDKKILAPDSYVRSQAFARKLRQQENSHGIVYPSVRHASGECIAVFLPRLISACQRTHHLAYLWDGTRITSVQARSLVKEMNPLGKQK